MFLAIRKAAKFEGMQVPNTQKKTYENLSQETHDLQETESAVKQNIHRSGRGILFIISVDKSTWGIGKSQRKKQVHMPNACITRSKLIIKNHAAMLLQVTRKYQQSLTSSLSSSLSSDPSA